MQYKNVQHSLFFSLFLMFLAAGTFFLFGYHAGFTSLNTWGSQLPETFWAAATLLGDTYVAIALTFFLLAHHQRLIPAALVATVPATLIAQSFKRGMPIERPALVLPEGSFNQIGRLLELGSFPSGHTMTAAVLFALIFLFTEYRWKQISAFILLFFAGVSRVMVGAHWPIDVMVGAAVGIACASLGYYVAHKYQLGSWRSTKVILFILPCYAAYGTFSHDRGYPEGHLFAVIAVVLAILSYCYHLYQRHHVFILRRLKEHK
ncbi:phosphatase PAP2 family protein [Gayadomonas joobiniege]|uniref:phosphatase PAP2 family protein n=1 Tax=Gayadomonas joobiniege TaxID=1234606 RepID=UPI000380CDB2|nr:phosphatase PAP2 family protein [Gayadomonas joobiniege]